MPSLALVGFEPVAKLHSTAEACWGAKMPEQVPGKEEGGELQCLHQVHQGTLKGLPSVPYVPPLRSVIIPQCHKMPNFYT